MSETTRVCPKCGTPVPAEAPHGLCPKCVLEAAATATETGRPEGKRAEPPSPESVASAFPQLEILNLIGAGGMGAVFKARQPKLERFVALKVLPEELAVDPAFAERFGREARTLARLNHPNIVTVYDFGQSGGLFYLLMEFVDGVNLRQAMQTGHFTPQQALTLVPKVCEALQFAHDEGILHRDIKPENILLDSKGRVKIADFGIAKLVGEPRPITKLTATGAAIGTPNYMAPEQIEHPEDVDQRADIYSLGVVFYEMLTGELPIGRFAPPSEKTLVDPRVDAVVFRALEREREKRYSNAGEVKTSVESITNTTSPGAVAPAPAEYEKPPGSPGQALRAPAAGMGSAQRWSKKAVAAALLAGIGLFPPLLMVMIAFFLAIPRDHSFSVVNAQTLFVFGTVLSLLPGLSGSLLGTLALSNIRRAGGQLRGRRLAFCATLFWPLLLLNVVLIGLVYLAIGLVMAYYGGGGVVWLFLPLALLGALGLDLLLSSRLWRWAVNRDVEPPRWYSSFAPAALVLCVALALSVPCLGFGFVMWMPMLAKVNRNAAQHKTVGQPESLREAFIGITVPPRQRFTATWTVFSNNIPIMGPVLFADSPTPAREPGQLMARWRVIDATGLGSDGAPWEVVLQVAGANPIVSRPEADSLPNLTWMASAARQDAHFTSSREQSFDMEILHAEEPSKQGPDRSRTHWSVRLTLRSSASPHLGTVTDGIGAQFTLPAGQVAVFEIVTRSNNLTIPIRNLGAYVLAPVDRSSEGTFRFTRDAEVDINGVRRRPWRIEISTAGGTCSSGGLDLPADLEPFNGALALGLGLLPDQEVVKWGIQDEENPPPNGAVGLRVRTRAHGLKPGMPRSDGAAGTGTNWKAGRASSEATPSK